MKKYSVVIPVYNVEKYLAKCIESVLSQDTKSEYEIILVDDGSPDSSAMICDAYAQKEERIQVIHQENKGISDARNAGLTVAKGEYVLFMDSDDYWENNLLSTVDGLVTNIPDMALFHFARVDEKGQKTPCVANLLPQGERGEEYIRRIFAANSLPLPYVWCYAYRREFLLQNHLCFNNKLHVAEDYEYNMKALQSAEWVVGTNEILYNYVVRDESLTATLSNKKIMDFLTTKVETFRRYPCSAVANDYAHILLLLRKDVAVEWQEIEDFLKKNKDIMNFVTNKTFRIAIALCRVLGFTIGLRLFWVLADLKHHISKKES